MKNYILLLLFIFCTATSKFQTEKYYVIFVKGNVTVEKTKKMIKVGDALDPNDKLLFANNLSKLSCISSTKGRFNISPKESTSGKSELYAVLKSNLVPVTSKYSLSTRSISFEGNDPALYFNSPETQNRILLIADKGFLIKPSYKMDQANFFFIQYILNGVPITRKIQQSDQLLFFSSGVFENTPESVSLCYQHDFNGKPKSTIVARFTPVVATQEELLEQLKLIKEKSSTDLKKFQSEITSHLFDNYGKIGVEEVSELCLKI